MRCAAAVILLLAVPIVAFGQASLNEFARGAEIRAEGGSIFRVVLPDEVYDTATRADLGDVRVLNAAGEAVPHSLRAAPRPPTPEAEWRVVPSFPMADVQRAGPARTQVRVDANGTVLEVTGDPGSRATTAHLVDASGIDEPLTRLALTWETAPDATFLSRVTVQGSDDLDNWWTIVPSAALAQLRRDSYMLTQNEIELPATIAKTKYIRISWPKELAGVQLTMVRVRPRTSAAQAETRWRTLTTEGIESSGAALYDARGVLPVQHVDLEFVDPSDVASVTIRSRSTPSSEWVPRHSGVFYSLQEASGAVRNSPVRIGGAVDRYWLVETAREGGWKAGRAPRLRLGWHPHELVFVAQGAAPYTLVYGSARAGATDAPVDALLASLDVAERERRVRPATLAASRSLGGSAALTPAPPVRQWVLWGVLVAAVAALAFLAMRVFRDTTKPAS